MVKFTVNLTDEAHTALLATVARTGDTGTDSVCRALLIYDAITAALGDGPTILDLEDPTGPVGTLRVTSPQDRR